MSEQISEQDAEKLRLLDQDVALAQERFRSATVEVAIKYDIHPERGDKLHILTREIIRGQ